MPLVSMNIEADLLKRLDALAKSQRRNRTAMVNHLVAEAVRGFNPLAGKLAPDGSDLSEPKWQWGNDAHLRRIQKLPQGTRITAENRERYASSMAHFGPGGTVEQDKQRAATGLPSLKEEQEARSAQALADLMSAPLGPINPVNP